MSDVWFCMINGTITGPYSHGEIIARFHQGIISLNTLVKKNDDKHWFAVSDAFPEIDETPPPLPHTNNLAAEIIEDTKNTIWSDTSPHPWRRYFARITDMMVNGFATIFGLSFVAGLFGWSLKPLHDALNNNFAAAVIVGFLIMPLNALLIGSLGTTLGKWLFGVRVLNKQSKPLGLSKALKREGLVFVYGLGFGLPLISVITLIMSYQKLQADKLTSWDKSEEVLVFYRKNTLLNYAVATIFSILTFFLLIVLGNMK